LKKINRKLNELAIILRSIINDVSKQILGREINRFQDAIECVFKFHLNEIGKGTQKIAPNFGIHFSESELMKVDFIGKVDFSFIAGFPVTMGTWKKPEKEKTGSKRIWWTLWIGKEDLYQTKMKELDCENATIPSIDDLELAWTLQKNRGESEVLKQVAPWFHRQLTQFNESVDIFQSETLERYQQRLEQAYQENKLDYDEKIEVWQPLQVEAKELADKIDLLGKVWD
jgi:hypothetical protein